MLNILLIYLYVNFQWIYFVHHFVLLCAWKKTEICLFFHVTHLWQNTIVVPPKQRPRTMDALFANMKENRMRVMSSHQQAVRDNGRLAAQRRRAQQQVRGVRGGALPGRWLGNSVK